MGYKRRKYDPYSQSQEKNHPRKKSPRGRINGRGLPEAFFLSACTHACRRVQVPSSSCSPALAWPDSFKSASPRLFFFLPSSWWCNEQAPLFVGTLRNRTHARALARGARLCVCRLTQLTPSVSSRNNARRNIFVEINTRHKGKK